MSKAINTKETLLTPFSDEATGLAFKGSKVFSSNGRNLMIGSQGHIMLVDDAIVETLRNGLCDEDLALKLLQRNLATLEDQGEDDEADQHEICPTFFMIDLTRRCNMSCKYCLREGDQECPSIDDQVLDDICDYIARYCDEFEINSISIQPWGGEPLLELRKIERLQDRLTSHGLYVKISLETNGLLLNDEIIQRLVKRNIFVSVSIDGMSAVHDQQRFLCNGQPSHQLVETGLQRYMKATGGETSVIVTLTRNSIDYIDEIMEYLAIQIGLERIKMNFVHQSAFCDDSELCLTPDEIRCTMMRILDKLIHLSEDGTYIAEYNIFRKLTNLLFKNMDDACISQGCRGGRSLIAFDMAGNIFPCDVTDFPEEKLGDIYDGRSLYSIVGDAIEQDTMYFRKKVSAHCEDCAWWPYCQGGCTVNIKCGDDKAACIDLIECSANKALYPRLVDLILSDPDIINGMMGRKVL